MPTVHEDCPAGVILTKGLGGDYDQWIVAHFNLFLGAGSPPPVEVEIEVVTARRGSGAASFRPTVYRPREDDDEEPWQPREDEEHEVIIKARIGSRKIERHYFVRKRTSQVVTQVINFVNRTRSRINITVSRMKKTTKDVLIKLQNLTKK